MLAPSGSAASPHRIKTAREIDRDLPIEQRIVAVGIFASFMMPHC